MDADERRDDAPQDVPARSRLRSAVTADAHDPPDASCVTAPLLFHVAGSLVVWWAAAAAAFGLGLAFYELGNAALVLLALTLAGAGLYELTGLKSHCLSECRTQPRLPRIVPPITPGRRRDSARAKSSSASVAAGH
ncbi:MAG: DUF2182 domain-containing protein [Thermoleophilia bacterium]|nr:DUF2182 domain-containing protein [Thermoleophilia bacterium]